ncbi:pyridoxal-phosphate-dependent aminotransferase family protein [Xanthobacter tagetidis]|uniref:Serine--glyoxylate aminotransferase n=1 Tax=Xanthobacter tagetidis TaxID=60216 RepID=A0A3L7AQN3_9HYPH|nr:aminotransferase class V-fold PLP-dependent enzyme [Xanthobacter tagetidis]MBB6308285.1 alanine-glyoxylate transaminase/serine-glyoxylate transaminase/serine-pyruvate transaminase [Xanthobacter tagetidis]RLP81890.1 aminotransferase class V-fold PLP-dependent enzyme [Xanthobacter tagetidis]
MPSNTARVAGRHFLQIPGPTPVPDRILRAMDMPVLDHRGPEFQKLGRRVLENVKTVFKTRAPVIIYPASGTGAWEAGLSNCLSPGDKVLMYETGHFATLWRNMAVKLALDPVFIGSDWRQGADPEAIGAALAEDKAHAIKAVCVVHNETSTGCVSPIAKVRKAIDQANHPALLLVDTISSLASIDYRHDEWGVDVTVAGSQKGLMLPPGLSFNAVSDKALAAAKASRSPKLFWSWEEMLPANRAGYFPYTPATNLLYGLDAAIDMLHEEGLENVFARHDRHAAATRAAVEAWGLEVLCRVPEHYSSSLTAVLVPDGHDADAFRARALEAFDISLGTGLTKLAGKVFRIGHLGDTNDLTILGALAGVEMGLELAGIPHKKGGVAAAMAHFTAAARSALPRAAE